MADLVTNWVDNIGMQADAAYLNALDAAVNANTHAQTLSGTYAGRPTAAASNNGAQYFCTDTDAIYKSNGSAWTKLRTAGQAGPPMADPPTSGWTALNMPSGATWAQSLDGMLLTLPSTPSTLSIAYQYRAYPTPPFTLTICYDLLSLLTALPGTGLSTWSGIAISDGTKYIMLGTMLGNAAGTAPWPAAGLCFGGSKWSNATTFSSAYNTNFTPLVLTGAAPKWFQYKDDGTNRTLSYSLNGGEWFPVGTESRTAFLTPTRIGFAGINDTGVNALMRLRSWSGVA